MIYLVELITVASFLFSALFIGATGTGVTGKTFKLVDLLKLYKKYDILDSKGNKWSMCIVLFRTTADSKANSVYNVLHTPEEDVILKYSDDKLGEKLNKVKNQKKKTVIYILALIFFLHKYDNVDDLTDDDSESLDKYDMDY